MTKRQIKTCAHDTGYKGQRYEVRYVRDGVERAMGWQNERTGGLASAAKLMPGVTAVRVVEAPGYAEKELRK